jgi:branched-chain amino acid aminotransferase
VVRVGDAAGLLFHVDGDLVPAGEATVSVRDRGFAYGDAAFETLRAYGGDVFEWEAHATRLRRTCGTLALDHGLADADLRGRVDATLAANDLADAYVRLSVTRGVQPGTLDPLPEVDPTVVVVVSELPRGGTAGASVWDGSADVRTAETRRVPDAALPAAAKTHNYLNGVLARLDGRRAAAAAGADPPDEVLLRDGDGHLAEGSVSNVFLVRDGVLHTPSVDSGPVLPGVTRRVVLELARRAGVEVATGTYGVDDVRDADEAFLTNSTWEVRPVATVDGDPVGGGAHTDSLARAFDELVEERHY